MISPAGLRTVASMTGYKRHRNFRERLAGELLRIPNRRSSQNSSSTTFVNKGK
jgi:hypothetical protein